MKQARKDFLSETKVQACQAKQANIQKRSDSIVKRTQNQINVFTQIAQRVEQYYNEKLVPVGKIVPNYAILVADVASKEAAIAPLVAKSSSDSASFSCDKDRPADQLKTFDMDMKAVIAALETYRKSVRNLIVGVKSITGQENSATGSAVPTTK